jgi:tetraacyldisaccharide 4'-kinase
MRLQPQQARNLHSDERRPLTAFRGVARLHAIAAIGNPERYFGMLRAAGLNAQTHAFADHHAFTVQDLAFPDAEAILMTAKDAVKCAAFADPRLWEVPVAAEFSAVDAVRLLALVGAALPQRAVP